MPHNAAQVIDLGDTMTFSTLPGQADALTCDVEGIPLDASNLVLKVYTLASILMTHQCGCSASSA